MNICCTHPGKIGDMLYILPTVRKLSEIHNCKIDVYTSSYCTPVKPFIDIQAGINECIIHSNYIIEGYDLGVRPWYMAVDESKYEKVYHLGFKEVPDKSIPEFIAETAGLDRIIGRDIRYNYVENPILDYNNYIVIAPRGETGYVHLFRVVIDYYTQLGINCYVVGGKGDFIGSGVDFTGCTFNDMASLIAGARCYLGIMSAPLVIANGFNVPKIIPYNNNWDMRHIVSKPESHYLFEPSIEEILTAVRKFI